MLTDIELNDIFDGLDTPEGGRKLVRKARKEAPVRRVLSNRSNLITRYPSQKMAQVISTESHTVEFAAMLHYECDPKVLEYYAQPVEVDQKVELPNGKSTRLQHTPDFLLITRDGILIEEWREETRLLKLAMKTPGKFLRQEDGWRFPAAEGFFSAHGIDYRLRSADELPRQFIQNLAFLRTYLDPSHPNMEAQELELLRKFFQDKPAIYLRQLLGAPGLTPDVIYKAIADKAVAFDLYNDNLGETDRVMVYRDASTMAFLQKSMAPSVGLPQERLDGTIQPGGKMVLDKKEYEILFVDGESVSATYQGKVADFPLHIVESLHQRGQLKLFPNPLSSHATKVDYSKLESYTPAELDAALERARLVEQAALAPNSVHCSSRTLQRYRRAVSLAGDSALERNLALIPKHALKGNRRRKIPREVIDLVDKIAHDKYNKPDNISVSNAYLHFVAACQAANQNPCSLKAFSQEIQNRASTRLRLGKRMAYQEGRFVSYLHIKQEVHGVRPFEVVHIDHTELQILLCLPNSKESLGRAWLTLAIDAESRAVVGFYLTFEPPSYRSCMMVMRDIVRRHGRLPEMLVLDNGKEFHSRAMMRLCALYGVTIRYRPSGQPRTGTVMERIFGTTQSQLINQLAGNTQVLHFVRSITKQVMPDNYVAWTLPGLHAALSYYFTELYGKEAHPAHGDGPIEHLSRRLKETGERRMRLVAFDRRFMVETCPSPVDRDTRVVDRQRGVKVNNFHYHCEEFNSPKVAGTTVEVRVDPWDIRLVYALVEGKWLRCVNNQLASFRSYTEVELRYALEEAKRRIQKKSLAPGRVVEWLKVLEPKNWDDRMKTEDDRQSECRRLYESLEMASVDPTDHDPTQATSGKTKSANPRPPLKKKAQADGQTPTPTPSKTSESSHWNQENDYELL